MNHYQGAFNEILKQKRLLLDLTMEEVKIKTGISVECLRSLETGRFYDLPADVYVNGYLKSLSKLYGLEYSSLWSLYQEEKGILNHSSSSRRSEPPTSQKFYFTLTPKIISTALLIFIFALGGVYMTWQINRISSPPKLLVESPINGLELVENQINVHGSTESNSILTINNQLVSVDENGKFSKDINLSSGQNEIVVRSKNRFDKFTEVKRLVIVANPPQVLGEEDRQP